MPLSKEETMLIAPDVGTYRSTGGLDANGFLAPSLAANVRPSNLSDRFRFPGEPDEEVDEDRVTAMWTEYGGRAAIGDDVPSLMTLGLDDCSVPWKCSVLDV